MPSRTLAATIQPQLGATAISSGTGSAIAQPTISSRRRGDEGVLAGEGERAVVAALEADRGDRVGGEAAAADRAGVVRGVEDEMVGQRHQPLGQRAVEQAGHLFDRVLAWRVEVEAAGVADQQRVAGEHEPRLVATGAVGHHEGVMGDGVTGRRDRLDLGVAEHDDLAVGQRLLGELDAGPLGKVCGRPGARHKLGQPGDVVGLHVRLEHGDDRHALALGLLDVGVDELDARVDHGEASLRLAAEQTRSAGGAVVQELAEVHGDLVEEGLDKLSSDLLNSQP